MNDNLVSVNRGQIVTNSRQVAEHFEKQHQHVIRDIENLVNKAEEKDASKIGQIPNVCKVSQQIGHPKRNPGKYATCQNLSFVPDRKRFPCRPLPHGCFLNLYDDYS